MTVPPTTPTLVVHSVLNPAATTQLVLLERTLTGQVTVSDSSFDPADPIVSGGGVPVSGALVEIIDSAGTAIRGIEDVVSSDSGKGAGVYRVPLAGASLRLGGRYELHVHTLEGEDATAFTRLPSPEVSATGGLSRTFNRDHDTLAVSWKPTAGARAYMFRAESPFGPFFLFTDSLQLRLTGQLRNPFAADLQRLFIPGFRQDIIITAVDSNFYDYYRTNNDPFTGSGIINRITGGIGLFGSLVTLNSGTINVVADQTDPIEGRFRVVQNAGELTPLIAQFTLYVESPAARSGLPSALSGRFVTGGANPTVGGVLGQQSGDAVSIAILRAQSASDTLDVFTGTLHGDTLAGTYRTLGGAVTFVRR